MKQALRRIAPVLLLVAIGNAVVVFVLAQWISWALALAWTTLTITLAVGVSVAVALRGTGRLLQPPRVGHLVRDEELAARLEASQQRTLNAVESLRAQVDQVVANVGRKSGP